MLVDSIQQSKYPASKQSVPENHQFFTRSRSRCSFFFRRASRSSSSRIFVESLGGWMVTALLFCLPLERERSDLLFLLLLLREGLRGEREWRSGLVRREWLCGRAVLFSLTRAVRLSMSFSNIMRLRLHSFSSWLRLKASSLIFSWEGLSVWAALLMRRTQISIFLLSSSRRRVSRSAMECSHPASSRSEWALWTSVRTRLALTRSMLFISSLNCLAMRSNSLILRSNCELCCPTSTPCIFLQISCSFSFSYWSSRVSVYRCSSLTTLNKLVSFTSMPSTRSVSFPTTGPKQLACSREEASGQAEGEPILEVDLESDLASRGCFSSQRCRQELGRASVISLNEYIYIPQQNYLPTHTLLLPPLPVISPTSQAQLTVILHFSALVQTSSKNF